MLFFRTFPSLCFVNSTSENISQKTSFMFLLQLARWIVRWRWIVGGDVTCLTWEMSFSFWIVSTLLANVERVPNSPSSDAFGCSPLLPCCSSPDEHKAEMLPDILQSCLHPRRGYLQGARGGTAAAAALRPSGRSILARHWMFNVRSPHKCTDSMVLSPRHILSLIKH